MLGKPRFAFVYRDPLATSIRENLAVDALLIDSIQSAAHYHSSIAALLPSVEAPWLPVSYEKAIQSPLRFCTALAELCGIPAGAEELEFWIQQTKPNHLEYMGPSCGRAQGIGTQCLVDLFKRTRFLEFN